MSLLVVFVLGIGSTHHYVRWQADWAPLPPCFAYPRPSKT